MNEEWNKLYEAAKSAIKPNEISSEIYVGSVGAAVLTTKENIYTGISIDTSCSLGMCAERNAIFQMITNGEQSFSRVLAIMPDGKNGAPCGACRELMVQLMPDTYKNVEILMDYDTERIVTLGELTPEWWI